MGSMNCMNEACRATTSSEWKKGWSLKSGGFAMLCNNCGSAYENSVFCERFHSEESGWRDCRICGKRIHCGCIVSRHLQEYMDFGGVGCITCTKRLEFQSMHSMQTPGDVPNGTFVTNGNRDAQPAVVENRFDDKFSRLLQLSQSIGANNLSPAFEQPKGGDFLLKTGECSKQFSNFPQQCSSSAFVKADQSRPQQGAKDLYESIPHPSLNHSLASSFNSTSHAIPFPAGVAEGNEQNKGSAQQAQRSRQILPKPPKPSPTPGSETNKGTASQTRVARPPAEGRGRNQLLPRYWPRITDQELQQLSGDLKSTIVPLFEKILSASDAGRIGRLVLPKACAEAYFPTINQSEGIPIRIQDIKGKEWTFQFRFWPNNNSRMYVLEGVTPCIQNMQLQAGDTVTFSRIDPGGQLVIGCRKATNNADVQDPQTSFNPNGDAPGEPSFTGGTENAHSNGGKSLDDPLQRHMTMSEKKKARNIKNKRLHMHSDDAMELRVTWVEAQELFRPCPDSEPSICMVDDYEFEEFKEPPIFGKRTIFTSGPSGEQEQLAQCDSCFKWRKLPVDALLSAKWTCSENIWNPDRSSCSAPEDISPRDLELSFGNFRESKLRKISEEKTLPGGGEPSGLDALATVAALGDNVVGELGDPSVGATTKHPRHRAGCSCIVCIQPPSGKGKHDPMCKCNVCMTVKRRFKTLMMRKRKKQSEREAELALGKEKPTTMRISFEGDDSLGIGLLNMSHSESEVNNNGLQMIADEAANKGQLDLNCDPHREDDMLAGMSLTTLMNAATLPFDMYIDRNEGPSLKPGLLSQNATDNEEKATDGDGSASGNAESENNHKDG